MNYDARKHELKKMNRVGLRAEWRSREQMARKSFGRRPPGRIEVDGRLA